MVDRNPIISSASMIEARLRSTFRAEGRMFGEVIAELQGRIPSDIVRQLRRISEMRANYAHYSDVELASLQSSPNHVRKQQEFFDAVEKVNAYLDSSSSASAHIKSDHAGIKTVPLSGANGRDEKMFSEWIIRQPINGMPILIKKPLHRDCYVVFTNRGAPHSVAPVSRGFVVAQAANFFCDGAIGISKELSFQGAAGSDVTSSDGVPVHASFHARFGTEGDRDEHLLEIARESNAIQDRVQGIMMRELRRYIAQVEFDQLADRGLLGRHEENIVNLIKEQLSTVRVVRLERLTLTDLKSATPSVKSQAQMEFEKRRRQVEEEEAERLRGIQIAQERQMRELGQEARLNDAKIDAAIMATRAEAVRDAGEYALSQEQLFEIFKRRIDKEIEQVRGNTKIEVAKQGREQWIALGSMRMLDRMSLGDSRVRVLNEQDEEVDDDDSDGREGF